MKNEKEIKIEYAEKIFNLEKKYLQQIMNIELESIDLDLQELLLNPKNNAMKIEDKVEIKTKHEIDKDMREKIAKKIYGQNSINKFNLLEKSRTSFKDNQERLFLSIRIAGKNEFNKSQRLWSINTTDIDKLESQNSMFILGLREEAKFINLSIEEIEKIINQKSINADGNYMIIGTLEGNYIQLNLGDEEIKKELVTI